MLSEPEGRSKRSSGNHPAVDRMIPGFLLCGEPNFRLRSGRDPSRRRPILSRPGFARGHRLRLHRVLFLPALSGLAGEPGERTANLAPMSGLRPGELAARAQPEVGHLPRRGAAPAHRQLHDRRPFGILAASTSGDGPVAQTPVNAAGTGDSHGSNPARLRVLPDDHPLRLLDARRQRRASRLLRPDRRNLPDPARPPVESSVERLKPV